ncbi:MAG: UDP-N-acetylmuramate--L-alanine ligase [Dissulfurimicrobium sp.]|uniref:UDP-N-acetylmuramate--L-alanine ligase n=1 Tax=Dissulfurimicrobium TaxID=1769732 RepID=UPI001EDA7275|nr:UDP-N-acetylmuramate--L-alanine ligase [Dissulfurimicrobium hydrothermale]UKL12888.1 UDP-N-acetylmuramate--L-alanine ligase [Dissulfurimicrobium hydrothermale]
MYKKQHIHFVGIGGIGMSGLARLLLGLGYDVSGSDLRETEITRSLVQMGGVVYKGHEAKNVEGADVVVYSSAVKESNPEIRAAMAKGVPVIPRAEMLAEIMRLKKFGIAVAGAHGKTSTTSMVASVLNSGGLDPTVVIGGKVKSLGANACWGQGEFVVAEADESDGSFLHLTPSIAVVTNIDMEHLDYYSCKDDILDAFTAFLGRVPFYGLAILCNDDAMSRLILPRIKKRVMTYGIGNGAELEARDISFGGMGVSYIAFWRGSRLGRIDMKVPGLHYLRNSLAAMAVGLELEIPFECIKNGLNAYEGVGRRFEVLGDIDGITVVDDYAHHPTEIEATLKAARSCWPDRRFVVLFEPHRYSRTKALMDEFAVAFKEADEVWITEIYPASETPIVGVSGERLSRVIKDRSAMSVHFVKACSDLPDAVTGSLRPGDVVFTLGAGSIGQIGRMILSKLGSKEMAVAL